MKKVIDFIDSYERFAVLTHLNPDGDALGSAFSLASALLTYRKQATVVLLGPPPHKYDMEDFDPLYMTLENVDWSVFDAHIAVDCADWNRLGEAKDAFKTKPNMNLDHHKSNSGYADVNYIREVAATGEIVYDIMKTAGIPIYGIAQLGIYMAISTDTGNFTFSNTTAKTLEICSELVGMGLDISTVAGRIFNERTLGATNIIRTFIDHIRLHADGKVSLSTIMLSDLEEAGAKVEDCENLVNYARDIDSVEVAVFVRELKQDVYKISLRAKNYVDVAEIAALYGGGGHARAAGCMARGNFHDVVQNILKVVEESIR